MNRRLVMLSFALAVAAAPPAAIARPTDRLAGLWDLEHVAQPPPPLLRHADVERRLRMVQQQSPDLFHLEEIGRSVENRSINHLWFGRGPLHVLLWSQMHGDEPTATSALFDVFEFVRRHRADADVAAMLDALTVHCVPMLNPDGAERYQRRNAQGIDINRDAIRLQTPEGRALKALRDRLNPPIGFNLHNENWRTSAGRTGRPATISLLAVAYDEAGSENPGRILAKKVCAIVRDAVEPLAPGQIARYDDEFEARAFGDNLTKWGTSTVLIETGPIAAADPDPALVRINFVALVSALEALGDGRAANADVSRYELLPRNANQTFYMLIRNASIVNGAGVAPFVGDIGIAATRVVRPTDGGLAVSFQTRIDDLGDLRVYGALETIDATGLIAVPAYRPARRGDEMPLDPAILANTPAKIAVGQPAGVILLRPSRTPGLYVVERVIGE